MRNHRLNMKTAVYFFDSAVFNALAYGDTTKAGIMREKAEIVIIGHTVVKTNQPLKVPYDVTDEEIARAKALYKGIIVSAPTL